MMDEEEVTPVRVALEGAGRLCIDVEQLQQRRDIVLVTMYEQPEVVLYAWNTEPLALPPSVRVIGRNTSTPFSHQFFRVQQVRTCDVSRMQLWQVAAVAEVAIGMLLMLSRQLLRATTCSKDTYDRDQFLAAKSLSDMQVVIAGTGRIAFHIAQRLQPWNCKVQMGTNEHDLGLLLQQADAVFISLPPKMGGRFSFGRDELAQMKNSAFLIDTSNEGVVDTWAALEGLRQDQLAGFGSDSMSAEMACTPRCQKLVEEGRLIRTPHIGGSTRSARAKTELLVLNEMVWRVQRAHLDATLGS